MRSLRARVTLAAAAGGLLVLLLAAAAAVTVYADRERDLLDAELVRDWNRDVEEFSHVPPRRLPVEMTCCTSEGWFTEVYGGDGSKLWGLGRAVHLPRQPPGLADVDGPNGRWRVYTQEAYFSDPAYGQPVVVVAANTRRLYARLARVRNAAVAGAFVGAGVIGVAVWLLAGVGLAPLARLHQGAHEISAGDDLSRRLPVEGAPELADTARALNRTLDRIQRDYRDARAALTATRTFTADAGHELRTPLTSLRANLELLARDDLDAADRDRSLRDSLAAHSRLTALIEGLQTLARGDAAAVAARSESVDLGELADAASIDARRRHPEVAFELEGSPSAAVEGDPDSLRMLLDNLLENAAVHGGHRVRVHVRRGERSVLLSVEDDGSGIPDEEKGRVFERFARGSAARNGTGSGLGLAIAAQQAELHGARLKLDDSPLGGARFEVLLSAPTE